LKFVFLISALSWRCKSLTNDVTQLLEHYMTSWVFRVWDAFPFLVLHLRYNTLFPESIVVSQNEFEFITSIFVFIYKRYKNCTYVHRCKQAQLYLQL